MSSQETILKSYQKILKDNIKTMIDNYGEIIKLSQVEINEPRNYLNSIKLQEQYEMEGELFAIRTIILEQLF